ncbi:MAG: adenylate/guanylate cyclase domain-containing protein [Bacteroidetes bacterium]|nr:adenylate/guanylate cyclase domain-containing protein [Bacteroidota bacterium]
MEGITIKPEVRYKLKQLAFIILWWVVMIRVFVVLEFSDLTSLGESMFRGKVFDILQQNIIAATWAGLVIGFITGASELFLFDRFIRKKSFLRILLIKLLVYASSIIVISIITVYFYLRYYRDQDAFHAANAIREVLLTNGFYHLFIVGILLSLGINFILLMQNKIGRGVFAPIIFGKYVRPQNEERIFLFIDLKSSTQMAEELGHEEYSRLIQDCFHDLSDLVLKHNGLIYQFVGDEAVITWKINRQSNYCHALMLFFEFSALLRSKGDYYQEKYGLVPVFKGALNAGNVTIAEVGGVVKSEIAYHGDVLNAASRMLELCKIYKKDLILPEHFVAQINPSECKVTIDRIGEILLRGKNQKLNIFCASDPARPQYLHA